MKNIVPIIICISIFRLHLQAQTTSRAGFDVNIYHPSDNPFFDQHENIDHIEGKSSAYSDKISDFMSREATSWLPRFDGGGKRAWPVRISVRVNCDESMRISIL